MDEPLRYYLDEDVYHHPILAAELRRRGLDVLTAEEAGRARQRIPDRDQLEYATRQGRVFVTQDVSFQPPYPHAGIVTMQRRLDIGDYIDYLELVAHVFSREDMINANHYCEL